MNKSGRGKIIIIMFAALLVFLAVFYFAANGKREENLTKLSATEATIQRDLDINYPQTPKAVVRYYAELSQCMYDPTNSDEEVAAIARQSRGLFDEELKAQQSDEQYLASLKNTIAGFINDNRRIVSFTISPSSEVVYSTLDIGEVASLYCTYTMQKGSVSYSDPEHFLLRKDPEGRWKILGWQSVSVEQGQSTAAEQGQSSGAAQEQGTKTEAPSGSTENSPTENSGSNGGSGSTESKKTEEKAEAPAVVIEKPTVEVPTVEINIPGVDQ